jgi:hypothetical protein
MSKPVTHAIGGDAPKATEASSGMSRPAAGSEAVAGAASLAAPTPAVTPLSRDAVLGQIVWPMMQMPAFRRVFLADLEWTVTPRFCSTSSGCSGRKPHRRFGRLGGSFRSGRSALAAGEAAPRAYRMEERRTSLADQSLCAVRPYQGWLSSISRGQPLRQRPSRCIARSSTRAGRSSSGLGARPANRKVLKHGRGGGGPGRRAGNRGGKE